MSKVFFALVLCLTVYEASCERCGSTTVAFRTHYTYGTINKEDDRQRNTGKRCSDFGGTHNPVDQSYGRNTYEGICKITVCGDGRVVKGHYCGRGSCNIFGYNCDGGCIPGDPVNSFKQLYDGKVWDVHVL